MKQIKLFAICLLLAQISFAQKVDFSIVSVPEESGIDFVKITQDGDYVCMPQVKRSSTGASWNTSHILDISKDGQNIAYLSQRNKTTNIFIKALDKQGSSIQRTTRTAIMDFSYSPDGKYICFSENAENLHRYSKPAPKKDMYVANSLMPTTTLRPFTQTI